MNPRIKNLVENFDRRRIDAFLVTAEVNATYLTSFPVQESWLFISPKNSFYITDARYSLEASLSLKGIRVEQYVRSFEETLAGLSKREKVKRIGFDTRQVSLAVFKRLHKNLPSGVKLVAADNFVEELRQIKTQQEVALIRQAIKINLKAYQFLQKVIKPGLMEKDVLEKLAGYVKSQKVAFSFAPIIASGPNSCFPHAKVTDRKLRLDEPVLVDMGIDFHGYKSDLTRMFFLGKIAPRVQKVCEAVRRAQRQTIEKIKPGVLAREVDQEARKFLEKSGLAKFFTHSLGHGVGLEIHEGPGISSRSSTVLAPGMVFTVEPGVYIPRRFGVRLEDMVLVTSDGCEVLSS